MKILQVITLSELGGAQTVVCNLANELCKEHEVIVAAGEGDGKMFSMLDSRVIRVQLEHLKRPLSPKHDLLALPELRKLYKRYKPDVIHLHSSKAAMLGRMALPAKRIVYTVHGFDSIRLAYRKFLPVERLMQYRCKAIVGVSQYDKNWMEKERITRNVYTIYNGIQKVGDIAPLLTTEHTRKRVLCIARVFPQKKIELFFEVAALLPQYDFIWIGNQHEISEHSENVYFLGNIPGAAAYCRKCDLFMLPSNYEGLPMVIIEAMCCGLPVVASNVGGVSEIVRNGENGYALENDAALFAEHITEILENEKIYKRMSENSYRRYAQDLTVDKMTDSYLKIYKK